MKLNLFIVSFLIFFTAKSQNWTGEIDSTSDILLKNRYVEIEASQAMYDMYNMNFDRAERQFRYLKKQYGWHPLPDFLIGLSYWWRLMPHGDMETKWDGLFLAYMDSSQRKAEILYEEGNKIEGAFFLAATYGFQGRLYGERSQYLKASLAGKNALNYLELCNGQEDFSPELLLGKGLFNYYAEWIPENYPLLKPLMAFFPDGDKKEGILQLKETARNAFYARTESQYYLLRILYEEENNLSEALELSKYLYDLYPNNSYFQNYYARILYRRGKFNQSIALFDSILTRVEQKQMGYEYSTTRYATYFLGNIYKIRGDLNESKDFFQRSIQYAELSNATDKGYYYYSWLHLGELAQIQGQWDQAMGYYKKVRKLTKNSHLANQSAKTKIQEINDAQKKKFK
jgi:tetratricopeptide (TPR) repeat protein